MVLPESTGNTFIGIAQEIGWTLRLRTDISDTEGRLPHRVLLALSPKEGECFNDRMVIRGPDQRYSEDYTALTRRFICLCKPAGRGSTGRIQQADPGSPV